MKEIGRTQSEREIAKLRKRNQAKSPVKENVRKFEEKSESPVQENVKKFNAKSQSPTPETSRGKSPNPNNQRPNTLYSPTRSKSPGLSSPLRSRSPGVQTPTRSKSPGLTSPMRSKSPGVQTTTRSKSPGLSSPVRSKSPGLTSPMRSKSPGVQTPNRSKSPGLFSPIRSKSPGLFSPIRSKSPLVNTPTRNESPIVGSPSRSKSPGIDSYNRSRSPGIDPYTRSKSPGINTINRAKSPLASSPTRSKSPGMISQSPASSPTKSPSVSKWKMNYNGWTKEGPVVAETVNNFESTPDGENLPTVGDTVDISWYFDNIELLTDTKAEETNTPAMEDVWPGAKSPGNVPQNEQRFRNSLNYNIAAWDDEENEDRPKKADEFIQRLCDQVRNHVEYLCGMNFIKYKAVSYKVRVAGTEGIFYYVKVNVWQNYCLHLRIFSHKNELKAIPALQAILERAQPDNGNIDFF